MGFSIGSDPAFGFEFTVCPRFDSFVASSNGCEVLRPLCVSSGMVKVEPKLRLSFRMKLRPSLENRRWYYHSLATSSCQNAP